MTLGKRAASAIVWSMFQQFGAKIIGFIISIILARILGPEEFGLVAMLAVFIAIGNLLIDSGLSSSLIRTTTAGSNDYSTVFLFNLLVSVAIYLIFYVAAPWVAGFYERPVLCNIMRVYSLCIIINAFFTIQNTILTKDLKFRLQANIQIPAALGGGVTGLIMAYSGWGVWSLVWMYLVTAMLSTLLHWIFSDWHPRLVFDRQIFKRHLGFGSRMTASGLLDALYQNLYLIVIGKYFSAAQLGFYSRAEAISQLPVSNISAAINKVTYPLFAEVADDHIRLKAIYRRLMQQVVFWNTPILIVLFITARPLVFVLLSEAWEPCIIYLKILSLCGIMYPLHAYNLNILKVLGKSDLFLRLEIVKKVLCVAGVVIALQFGIEGLLYYQLIFNVLAYYINSYYSGQLILYPVKEQLLDIAPTLIIAVYAGLLSYLFDGLLHDTHLILRLVLTATMYIALYLLISMLVRLSAVSDFKNVILKK